MILRTAFLSLLLLTQAAGQSALIRAIDIRTLPYERSLKKLPVDLTATVSYVESGGTAFVQDESAGTHLHFKDARHDLRAGDQVRVKGFTMAGLYLPGIDVTDLRVLAHGSSPAPVKASYEDLAAGRFHYQTVSVYGVGRTLTPLDEHRSLLRLTIDRRVIEVRVDAALESSPRLVDAGLRITALAAGGINDRRQLVFPYLRVIDWSDIEVIKAPPAADSLPISSVASLLPFGSADGPQHRVRIRGTVLASLPDGRVFLRDSTPPPPQREPPKDEPPKLSQSPSIAIRLASPIDLEPGQWVEVLGFPIMAGFSASLTDAAVLRTEPAQTAEAADVSLKEFLNGSHDADLIHLTEAAVLEDLFRTTDGFELRFTSAGAAIRAFLLDSNAPNLEIGSSCDLKGICLVESATTDKGFRSEPDRALILLRSAADIQVLSTAPFWTARHLVIAIACLGGFSLITLFWITQQRRQISRLQAKIVEQATLEERQRIAREFHDTLEQELAGLSLRLDAAITRPLEEKARSLIETSRNLVSRVQSEARNLVSDLRETDSASTLTEALQQLAKRTPESIQIKLDLNPIPPIPSPETHHLRMIAQEAITNALKHSEATEISIHLSSASALLTLFIADNGKGFDSTAETQHKPGHFGCLGIRERCFKMNAQIHWQSAPNQGTKLTITLPLVSKH